MPRIVQTNAEILNIAQALGWRDVREADMLCWRNTGIPPDGESHGYSTVLGRHGRPETHRAIPRMMVIDAPNKEDRP